MPLVDQELLEDLGYKKKLHDVDQAILANAKFLNQIVANPEIFGHDLSPIENEEVDLNEQDHEGDSAAETLIWSRLIPVPAESSRPHSHSHSHTHTHDHSHSHSLHESHPQRRKQYEPSDFDMDKLRSTIKQFVRDWSEEVP